MDLKNNKRPSRHEIWLAELPQHENSHVQSGRRPVLILSSYSDSCPIVQIIPLTSKTKKTYLPTHILLQAPMLRYQSMALCEQIQTVDKSCLVHRISSITRTENKAAYSLFFLCDRSQFLPFYCNKSSII